MNVSPSHRGSFIPLWLGLRFALLRSVVTALRGVRGRKSGSGMKDLSNVNFDFVPEGEMYESF